MTTLEPTVSGQSQGLQIPVTKLTHQTFYNTKPATFIEGFGLTKINLMTFYEQRFYIYNKEKQGFKQIKQYSNQIITQVKQTYQMYYQLKIIKKQTTSSQVLKIIKKRKTEILEIMKLYSLQLSFLFGFYQSEQAHLSSFRILLFHIIKQQKLSTPIQFKRQQQSQLQLLLEQMKRQQQKIIIIARKSFDIIGMDQTLIRSYGKTLKRKRVPFVTQQNLMIILQNNEINVLDMSIQKVICMDKDIVQKQMLEDTQNFLLQLEDNILTRKELLQECIIEGGKIMKKLFNFIDRGETIERNILFLKALMIREQWIKSLQYNRVYFEDLEKKIVMIFIGYTYLLSIKSNYYTLRIRYTKCLHNITNLVQNSQQLLKDLFKKTK